MKAYGGVDVYIHIFLTSALVGGERSASRPGRFTPDGRAPGIIPYHRAIILVPIIYSYIYTISTIQERWKTTFSLSIESSSPYFNRAKLRSRKAAANNLG
jgi:hypothetical protein